MANGQASALAPTERKSEMRQPANRQSGAAGETAVRGFFEDLGWGVIGTGDHDVGTDLYLQLRDEGGVELLLMLGVQVKTGKTTLGEATTVDGESGWWFREPDHDHLDYWSDHPVPHIIVLQDETKKRRYWAFLDRESIEITGKGIRVFVPASQPLDDAFRTTWGETADRARRRVEFEGSRWNYDVSPLPTHDQARMALLTPRLVAPHPNKGSSTAMTWAQAAATVVDFSAARWEENADRHESVPGFDEALSHDDVRCPSNPWPSRHAPRPSAWRRPWHCPSRSDEQVSPRPPSRRSERTFHPMATTRTRVGSAFSSPQSRWREAMTSRRGLSRSRRPSGWPQLPAT
jgi:hypothetical protein